MDVYEITLFCNNIEHIDGDDDVGDDVGDDDVGDDDVGDDDGRYTMTVAKKGNNKKSCIS